jgi:hypothetical protein
MLGVIGYQPAERLGVVDRPPPEQQAPGLDAIGKALHRRMLGR